MSRQEADTAKACCDAPSLTAHRLNSRGTRAKGDTLEAMASEADLARMAAMSAEIEELSERRVSAAALSPPSGFCSSRRM